MCGIVGTGSVAPIGNRDLLVEQRDTMTHRGPDDAGVWWSGDGCVGLAHRRLAIIDLSPAGHQPMMDSTGRLCITFNGEIYNYRELRLDLEKLGHSFRSTSDTEVILEAYSEWGVQCLALFNGMFAFGLYDSNRRVLFLARDRAGEKPLFYWHRSTCLTFASELKAIMADPHLERSLDLEGLQDLLAWGYVPGEGCIIRGVNKLPAAHAALFDLFEGSLRVWRYWGLPESATEEEKAQSGHGEGFVCRLERLLAESVSLQLVADVPVGVLLSGGIDSSLVTAMAARNGKAVKTFTIRFPDYEAYDETPHARLIADHFATDHVELVAEPSTVDLIPELARQFDEPIADSSVIPTYLVSRLVREHCTVALGGDGGDELFGGYGHYSQLLRMERRIGWVPRALRDMAARLAQTFLPVGLPSRNFLMRVGCCLENGLPNTARLFDYASQRSLLSREVAETIGDRSILGYSSGQLAESGNGVVDKAQRSDFHTYLPEDILVKVDRASMLNSLEVRAPLLDYRIIEFAFGRVPSSLKVGPDKKKILLKMLGKHLLPSSFDYGRKQGFSVPLALWLRNQWRKTFQSLLFDTKDSLFDRTALESLWRNHQRGFSNSERLFGLLMIRLWTTTHKITF